ncbi:hypothetical protein RB595_000743 [Gaeumannomyces hyphopodioides]
MAPLAADPRQLLVVLNTARRRALYTLVDEITQYMRFQLVLKHRDQDQDHQHRRGQPGVPAPLFVSSESRDGCDGGGHGSPPASLSPRPKQTPEPPTRELIRLRAAAVAHLDEWRRQLLKSLKDIAAAPDDAKITEARQERQARLQRARADTPRQGENLLDFDEPAAAAAAAGSASSGGGGGDHGPELAAFQRLHHPIPTRLTTIPREDREEALSCVLVMMLSTGAYTALSRTLAVYLASALDLPPTVLAREEAEIARSLVESSTSDEAEKQRQRQAMTAEAEAQKRRQEGQASRFWKVGLASVAGAAVIGITGGLAAPLVAGAIGGIMGSVGLGSLASFLGIFWMNSALVGALFGAYGAKMTGEMMDQYAREVDDFRFIPLNEAWGKEYSKEDKDSRRLRVTIGINGWLSSRDDIAKPWRVLGADTEVFALQYEIDSLLSLGTALRDLIESYTWGVIKVEIIKRTALAALYAAMWPLQLLKVASTLDNPFNRARNRSEKAGRVLADAIINKVQGERPVTLIGYSLGARVIHSCLTSLAERRAFGLVDQAVFIGAPVPSGRAQWEEMRSVVSGKLFNAYSENDFILAFVYRATSIQLGVAGLEAVEGIDGVENLDLSNAVSGHLRYPDLIAKILARCGFPDVEGGEGPIETDKDVIELRDEDGSAKQGSLIDLGDDAAAVAPEPKSQLSGLPAAGRHARPAAPRSNSDVLMQQLDPMAALAHMDQDQPQARQHPGGAPAAMASASAPQLPTASPSKTKAYPAPPLAVLPRPAGSNGDDGGSGKPADDAESDSDDSGDDGHVGIRMEDNDDGDMVTYDAPIPLDD